MALIKRLDALSFTQTKTQVFLIYHFGRETRIGWPKELQKNPYLHCFLTFSDTVQYKEKFDCSNEVS